MMVEAFRRLRFGSVESYQYVGLGSVYFSDFTLIHRALGVSKMISIEREEDDRERFEENLPFGCVEMLWGDTSAQLPNVDLAHRSIVWLDYDGRLSRSILGDIAEVCKRAVSGSVLAVTVQCRFDKGGETEESPVEALRKALGEDRIPFDLKPNSLFGPGTGRLFRSIIVQEIEETLRARNIGIHPGQHMRCRQILNFRYEDGVKMMTVAFVLYDAGQQQIFDLCGFEDLAFYRAGEDTFDIAIPKLTTREIRRLEGQMPSETEQLRLGAIPPKDADQYASIYRYFPNVAFID
jgi:hypothetical protein